jgi:predicted RNase H-like nuclease (RuvC/YqgF family)
MLDPNDPNFVSKSIEQLKAMNTNLLQQVNTLNVSIKQVSDEQKGMQESVNRLDIIKQEMKTEITSLKTQLDETKKDVSNLEDKTTKLSMFVPDFVHKVNSCFVSLLVHIKTKTLDMFNSERLLE